MPIGDSQTYGFGDPVVVAQGAWRFNINAPLGVLAHPLVWCGDNPALGMTESGNRMVGLGGQRTDQILSDYFPARQLNTWSPDLVVIHIGTNDMIQLDLGSWPFSVAVSVANLSTLLDIIRTNRPQALVVVCQIGPHRDADVDALMVTWIAQATSMIAARADTQYIAIATSRDDMVANVNWSVDYMWEAIHFNAAGQQVLSNSILSAVQSLATFMPRSQATPRLAMRQWGDKSLRFDGVDDYVDFGTTDFAFERTQAFSACLWAYQDPILPTQAGTFFGRNKGNTTFRGWYFTVAGNGSINLILANDLVANASILSVRSNANTMPRRRWVRVGFSYDGSSLASGVALYIDGVPVIANTILNTLNATIVEAGLNTRLGTVSNSSSDFAGFMTDLAVYNRVLTAAEMADIHFNGNYPSSPYALYKFTEGSGASLGDTSGNARNGTITAATWNTAYAPIQKSRSVAATRAVATVRNVAT